MKNGSIEQQIMHGMARAFFACAWADQAEECGESGMMSGCDIMDIMPLEIDPAAIHAADTLSRDMVNGNQQRYGNPIVPLGSLRQIYERAQFFSRNNEGDRKLTPDLFGHYCAMQAMGTGVGLESFGSVVRDAIYIPYLEFGSHSLERDYFPSSEERVEYFTFYQTTPLFFTIGQTSGIYRAEFCISDGVFGLLRAIGLIEGMMRSKDLLEGLKHA